jgi:TrpR family trp operon transcriptional repressor
MGNKQKQALFPQDAGHAESASCRCPSKGRSMNATTRELIQIFTHTSDAKDMEVLFHEIFTPNEINTLTLRWQLLKDLYEGKTQRKIAAERKISLCKITRGSKLLKTKGSYLKRVLDGLYKPPR